MSFNIIVCVKQVPDSDKVKIDSKTGSLIRKGVPGILNSDDRNALEAALAIRDNFENVHITAVTMGPPASREVLFEAIAKGADEGILINDIALANSDTFVTSTVLEKAITKWASLKGGYNLIIAGRESSDGNTAQVGPQLAEKLGIPQITYVSDLDVSEDMSIISAVRRLDGSTENIEADLPCLITVTKYLNTPRYPKMCNIFGDKNIVEWNAADLGLADDSIGLEGSESVVISTFAIKNESVGTFIEGQNGTEQAINLLSELHRTRVI